MTRSRKQRSAGRTTLFFGATLSAVLIYTLSVGRRPMEWADSARRLAEEQDFAGALDAAAKALEVDPNDTEMLYLRATTYRRLLMRQRALEDIDNALSRRPRDRKYLFFKVSLLGDLLRHDEGIRILDDVLAESPASVPIRHQAAMLRSRYFDYLSTELTHTLERNHPQRMRVRELLRDHFASSVPHTRARRELTDPLPGQPLREELLATIDRAWQLLREADKLLGDIRTQRDNDSSISYLLRGEVDLRLGRLIAAKENLQTILMRALPTSVRIRARTLLSEVLLRSHALAALEANARALLELQGESGPHALFRRADVLEAEFLAAEVDLERRDAWIRRADQQIDDYAGADLRTLAYRGIAALEWKNDPRQAIACLSIVYESLRLKRPNDRALTEPDRTRRFMNALLEAYLAANQPERGLQVANTLLDLAPDDVDLSIRRARIEQRIGRYTQAAEDVLRAMRHGPRDPETFQIWLDAASLVTDASGRTPLDLALAAAERWRRTKASLKQVLSGSSDRQNPRRIANRMVSLGKLASSIATDPVVAWHMAQEFGRQGETLESRNFLFHASTAEPDVEVFRFRLGQFRLDLGLFETAAEDFERILSRDPTDVLAAEFAIRARRLAGQLDRARRVAHETVLAAPARAALPIAVDLRLDAGDVDGALALLEPHRNRPDAEIAFLVGQVLLAKGEYAAAREQLEIAERDQSQSAEIISRLVLCYALEGLHPRFVEALARFANLPRLLPAREIESMLSRLEEKKAFREAAELADAVLDRFSDDVALAFRSRAALDAFFAGESTRLRELRDATELGPYLDNDVIRAAFGLTLREEGPHAAALYLKSAREYAGDRTWATLPTAAAFALTPFQLDLQTFLGRYHRAREQAGEPVIEDATLWALTYERAEKKPSARLAPPAGAASEIAWIRTAAPDVLVSGKPLVDEYIRALLFDFAGRGFEANASESATHVVDVASNALAAARIQAKRLRETGGPEEAARYLLNVYEATPDDVLTYEALGRLMMATPQTGRLIVALGVGGRKVFPALTLPSKMIAIGSIATGRPDLAAPELLRVLEKTPEDVEALHLLARVADSTNDPTLGERLTQTIAEHVITDPVLLAYVARRYSDVRGRSPDAMKVLSKLIAADATFYAGAVTLARHLAAAEQDGLLATLAARTAAAVPHDPKATTASADLLALAEVLVERKRTDVALTVVDAALEADPGSVELRHARVRLLTGADRRGEAIDDLRVLTTLAPRNVAVLLDFGEILLEERTDLADQAMAALPALLHLVGNDPRIRVLAAKNAFRLDDLAAAIRHLEIALALNDRLDEARYLLGVYQHLAGNDAEAVKALSKLSPSFRFVPRARQIVEVARAEPAP